MAFLDLHLTLAALGGMRLPPRARRKQTVASNHGEAAFTLVELLTAIAILAILLTIGILSYNAILQRGQAASCASNMRQIGIALNLYQGEHNGWFPPGYPVASNGIPPQEARPGMPEQIGTVRFKNFLVPNYLSEIPQCPARRLTSEARSKLPTARYADAKTELKALNCGYAINRILMQWKPVAMPWPAWGGGDKAPYRAAKTPLLLEVACYAENDIDACASFTNQNQALDGIPGSPTGGRSHASDDGLNFLFLDGHLELIRRNDSRDVKESDKSWLIPSNPKAAFAGWGENGRYIRPREMSPTEFKQAHPEFYLSGP